jgi:hypothetical protein
VGAAVVLAAFFYARSSPSQSAPTEFQQGDASKPPVLDGWYRPVIRQAKKGNPAPAPKHDISGTWDPGQAGIQILGAGALPDDGNPEHTPPYTALGLQKLGLTKPSAGFRTVLPTDSNDPAYACNPAGMPRLDLHDLRVTEILQTPREVIVLYQFGRIWRKIWTDGRDFPKDPEPRWLGYSVGKWVDDTTLVVQTWGTDERTWIDRAGRPHSTDLRVEERFHRVDGDHLELSVTVNDPKMYTKPWVSLDKLRFQMMAPDYDSREMMCSPAELDEYNRLMGAPLSNTDGK